MAGLQRYETKPGTAAAAPVRWAADSRIAPPAGRMILLMALHPRCPCSRASIGELDGLMARARGRVSAFVLFYAPAGAAQGWEKTGLWRSAAAIPGVTPLRDDDAVESRRWGALTSGQTLLYDAQGRLLFSGGITSSRGHSGRNQGTEAVHALIMGEKTSPRGTPVYGCALTAARPKVDGGI
ncbi:MAG: RedB protein [Elusimicrobia bacterium]|nr:RedB protein [Elusimicrobiota bacterium]